MIVKLIPYFLAAHLVDKSWPNGAETTYRFCVNSTAITESPRDDRSSRLNFESKLKCRHLQPNILTCRITDSHAFSFMSEELDPLKKAEPIDDKTFLHPEYQITEELFQVTFNPVGIVNIVVNRSVSPVDLNIIRAAVNQLNVGADMSRRKGKIDFNYSEKSMNGQCDTMFHVIRNHKAPANDTVCTPYRLRGLASLSKHEDFAFRLEKWRNVWKCSIRADYFFGDREVFIKVHSDDLNSRLVSSESSINVSDMHFTSYTFNELKIPRDHLEDMIIYENLSLTLASIEKATEPMPRIVDPVQANLYAYQYIDDMEFLTRRNAVLRRASSSSSSSSNRSNKSRRKLKKLNKCNRCK